MFFVLQQVGCNFCSDLIFQFNRFPTAANQEKGYIFPNLANADEGETKPYELFANVIETNMPEDDYALFQEGGAAVDFVHQEGNYWWYDESGEVLQNKGGAWIILTDNDIVSTQNSFGELYARFDDFFLPTQIPAVRKPEAVFNTGISTAANAIMAMDVYWIINDGAIYGSTVKANTLSRGFTPPTLPGMKMATSRETTIGTRSTGLYWDNTSQTLYFTTAAGVATPYTTVAMTNRTNSAKINEILGRTASVAPNATILRILRGGGLMPGASSLTDQSNNIGNASSVGNNFIIAQDGRDSKYYLFQYVSGTSIGTASTTRGIANGWEIPSDADIVANPAPVMASSYMNDVIYYAKNGNQLWCYSARNVPLGDPVDPASSYQSDSGIQIGGGETIVQIEPLAYNNVTTSGDNNYRALAVLTKTGTGYKYYLFFNTGDSTHELKSTPEFVFEGEGDPVKMFNRIDYVYHH